MGYDIKDYAVIDATGEGMPDLWSWKLEVIRKYPRKELKAMNEYFADNGIIVGIGLNTILDLIDEVGGLKERVKTLEKQLKKAGLPSSRSPRSLSSFLRRH